MRESADTSQAGTNIEIAIRHRETLHPRNDTENLVDVQTGHVIEGDTNEVVGDRGLEKLAHKSGDTPRPENSREFNRFQLKLSHSFAKIMQIFQSENWGERQTIKFSILCERFFEVARLKNTPINLQNSNVRRKKRQIGTNAGDIEEFQGLAEGKYVEESRGNVVR